MTPDEIEDFTCGEIEFTIHRWYNPLRVNYWITAGAAAIQMDEDSLMDLAEILEAFTAEVRPNKKAWWKRYGLRGDR